MDEYFLSTDNKTKPLIAGSARMLIREYRIPTIEDPQNNNEQESPQSSGN